MAKIHSLNIYPIKGMRGISLQSAELLPEGFKYDRRWMLVDPNGKFISQRTHPEMTLFKTSIDREVLMVKYLENEIKVNIEELSDRHIDVNVFDDTMKATIVGQQTDEWFSEQLKTPLHLVKVSAITNRVKDFSKYVDSSNAPSNTVVSFADGYPYLILSTASMDLLNSKMEVGLDINRFRANIVVQSDMPHIEDSWKSIQIGNQKMLVVRPCARCQVPTIDQKTGIQGKQPNTALARYRRDGNKVIFGMNAVARTHGMLTVGDSVSEVE